MLKTVNVDEDDIWVEKDKDAVRTFEFDVSCFLAPGDTVVSAAWSVAG